MIHEEGFFEGTRNTRIYHQCWLPDTETSAVLLIVHGLGEHSGRYGNVVRHFVPLGFAVYGMDHPGHGKSGGMRKYVDRFDDFIENVQIYFGRVQAAASGKPIFLIGHSMGGLISSVYLLDHQSGLKGAVLSGSSVKVPDSVSPVTVFIGKMLNAFLPRMGLVHTAPEGVSRDPAVVQAYIDDPLVSKKKTTVRLAAEMMNAMQRVQREAGKITLPVLILHGGADWIVDPAASRMLYDAAGSTDKEMKIYEGLYHEVYNEPEHPRVLQDVERWIRERMA